VFLTRCSLFNRFHDKLLAAIKTTPGVKGWLLRKAFATKTANLRKNILTHKFYDAKVFSKVKARMGFDRVRLMVTGSAPIAPHVMDLLRAIFGYVSATLAAPVRTVCALAAVLPVLPLPLVMLVWGV
jgi:long-chain acyl-CoA synthetase